MSDETILVVDKTILIDEEIIPASLAKIIPLLIVDHKYTTATKKQLDHLWVCYTNLIHGF